MSEGSIGSGAGIIAGKSGREALTLGEAGRESDVVRDGGSGESVRGGVSEGVSNSGESTRNG